MKTSLKTRPLAAFCGLAVAAAASLALVPAFAEDAAPDKVVATINGTPITEGDLGIAAQEFGEQLQRIPPNQQRTALIRAASSFEPRNSAVRARNASSESARSSGSSALIA